MTGKESTGRESDLLTGGEVPGAPGIAAYRLSKATPSALPLLIAVPHAGRAYPESVIARMRHPASVTLKLEDRYADRLGERVAQLTGAGLLVAQAPRALIDLNRSVEDVDWDMIGQTVREARPGPGLRARSGLGLVPRRLAGLGEIWRTKLDESELVQRIDAIHAPYHACLSAELDALRRRWGHALLLDLHSMPPLPRRGSASPAEFVIGDRFGATCHGSIVAAAFGFLSEGRRMAAHNQPYAGGYGLDRHADVARGLHAIQLEIDRSSYLDARLVEPGSGFDSMVDLLCGLVHRLGEVVADLGSREIWSEAAE